METPSRPSDQKNPYRKRGKALENEKKKRRRMKKKFHRRLFPLSILTPLFFSLCFFRLYLLFFRPQPPLKRASFVSFALIGDVTEVGRLYETRRFSIYLKVAHEFGRVEKMYYLASVRA